MDCQELIKFRLNQGLMSNLYFWRDSQGHEIDILMDQGNKLVPLEIKSGQTITSDYFEGLQYWQSLANLQDLLGWCLRDRKSKTHSSRNFELARNRKASLIHTHFKFSK